MKHHPLQFVAAVLVLGSAGLAHASDKAAVIFPAEGNKQCSDYAANSMILQMATTSPLGTGLLAGLENPMDSDSTGESVSYAIAAGKTVSFSGATTPIDFALLKSGKYVSLIVYPSGGVTDDANMKLTLGGVDQPISAISLCYGLGNVAPPPPPPPAVTTIPSCDELNANGGLDGIQVMCPSNGARSIVYNFELDESLYSKTGSPLACVCNSQALQECDPNVAYDSNNPENNACPRPADTGKNGAEVTTHIELNNDPYTCYTIGGVRKCYYY
jgi:hypothetical protein